MIGILRSTILAAFLLCPADVQSQFFGEPTAAPLMAAVPAPDIFVDSAAPSSSSSDGSDGSSSAPSALDNGSDNGGGLESLVPTSSPAPSLTPLPNFIVSTVTPGSTPTVTNVQVTCAFDSQWTSARHPNDYPDDDAQWSPMVMASHSDNYQMWGFPGMLASDGVALVAETGNTSALIQEMGDAGVDVLDQQVGAPIVLAENPNQKSLVGPLLVDWTRSRISTITMIAPSPDWFTGFYDFTIYDEETSIWYDNFVIQTYPWDAGTDAGTTYLSDDAPIDPALWIYQLTPITVPPTTGVFLDPEGVTVLPVAEWSCNVVPVQEETTSGGAGRIGRASTLFRITVPQQAVVGGMTILCNLLLVLFL